MLNPNAYLFTQQQQQAPQFKPIANPNPGEWYNPYLELGQGYYQPDSEVKEDAPAEEVKAEVESEDNSLTNTPSAVDPNQISLGGLNRLQGILGKGLSNNELGIAGALGLGPLAVLMKGKGLYDAYQGLDAYAKRVGDTREGAIARLNNSNAKIKGNVLYDDDTSNDNQRGFTEDNSNDYIDMSGNIRDVSNVSDATRAGLEIASQEDHSEPTYYDNTGGMPMRNPMIAYRQVGGPATPPPQPQGAPVEPQAPVPPAPQAGQPATPPPTPRKTFAEKVAEAKAALRGEMGLGGPKPEGPQMAPADGQGDSGILDPGGIFEPSQSELGPDMAFQDGTGATIGADDIDGHLPEGAMVMNPEASEMFAEELQAMARGGYV